MICESVHYKVSLRINPKMFKEPQYWYENTFLDFTIDIIFRLK